MIRSDNRLKKRKEFAYLYNNGTAKHTSHITIVFNPTKNRKFKIGFSVAKKIGKAHTRNLIKRRLGAIVQGYLDKISDNYNIVFIAKSGIETLTFAELKSEMDMAISKSGILKNV